MKKNQIGGTIKKMAISLFCLYVGPDGYFLTTILVEVGRITWSHEITISSTVLPVQYPIRVFNHFNLTFIKPVEVTTECYGLLNNRSNKTALKPH